MKKIDKIERYFVSKLLPVFLYSIVLEKEERLIFIDIK